MISNQSQNHSVPVNDFSLEKNQTVNRILIFIKNTLPEFQALFIASDCEFYLEDDISKELLRFFNDKSRTENLFFQFNEKKGVDFTIYTYPFRMGAQSILMIEAKRLSKEHYDYVSYIHGKKTGGIERIKREQDEFGSHLNSGAMIGYIQDHDVEFWENKINTWIDELIVKDTDIEWCAQDKLIRNREFSDFTSIHGRISKESITLFHYWMNFN